MRNYRDLNVWRHAHQLTLALYKQTASFPASEIYGLTSQTRRACVSIQANLAEGCGRWGDGEMARFVQIAMGSASELDCHLLIARDLGYLSTAEHGRMENELSQIRRMLTGFLQKILQSQSKAMNQQLTAKSQELTVKSQELPAKGQYAKSQRTGV